MYAIQTEQKIDDGLLSIAKKIFGKDFERVRVKPWLVCDAGIAGAFSLSVFDADSNSVNLPLNLPRIGQEQLLKQAFKEYQQRSKQQFFYKPIPAMQVPARVRSAIEKTAQRAASDLKLRGLPEIRFLIASDDGTGYPAPKEIAGYYDRATRIIFVRVDLPIAQVKEVTAHELKHHQQHLRGDHASETAAEQFAEGYRGSELSESDLALIISGTLPLNPVKVPCDHSWSPDSGRVPTCPDCERSFEAREANKQKREMIEGSGLTGAGHTIRNSFEEMHQERRFKTLRGDEV